MATYTGIREDKALRELDGKRFVYHIDLTTASWMSNPDYQIRQNDIIIVTPNKLKVNSAGLSKTLYRP
jgi:polysaccharide export outer membrane protein